MADHPPLRYRLYRLMWSGLDLFFPPTCPGCGEFAVRWCESCQRAVQPLPASICQICGEILPAAGICPACQRERPPYEEMRSWAFFNGPLRAALHTLKYKRNFGLGISLAEQIDQAYPPFPWPLDMLIPIPLSPGRKAERGYNQVSLVAAPLADRRKLPLRASALRRVRETRSQVGLNAQQRRENVQHIFEARPRQVAGKNILLMDDVVTTGATLADAARALREAGAAAVYAFSIARAPLQ